MEIHFCFPISADITLCGELTDDEPVVMNITKVTCPRCEALIKEISRQALGVAYLQANAPLGSQD